MKKYVDFIPLFCLLLIISVTVVIVAKAQTAKSYPAVSFARVDTLQGLYIFYACNPVQKATVLGTVTINYYQYPTYQFFTDAAAYSKQRYPSAQGLIFYPKESDSVLLHWDVIKF